MKRALLGHVGQRGVLISFLLLEMEMEQLGDFFLMPVLRNDTAIMHESVATSRKF